MSIPKLRFPEFKGEWTIVKLENIIEDYSERVRSDTNIDIYSSTREGLLPQKEYYNGQKLVNEGEYGVVPNGFFVYRHMSDDGTFKFNINNTGNRIAVSKEYPVFVASCIPYFLLCLFNNSASFASFALQLKKGGTRTRLYLSILKSWSTEFPSLPEQQKIADCLSSLDDLLAAHNQRLAALKTHKKGLMQKLFPAEGETVPKLRFPEFRDKGEWEENTISAVAEFSSGGTPSKDNPDYWNGKIPWISASSMHEYSISKSDLSITQTALNDGAKMTKKGTLLLLVRGSMLYKRIPMGICENDVAFNQDVKALTISPELSSKFLLLELVAKENILLSMVGDTGIGAGKLETDDLKKLNIQLPRLSEQQKIVDCLSSLDDLIAAQVQKIEALKQHKKCLMQQLFPQASEVDA